MKQQISTRLAKPGEVCPCGRPAIEVFLGGDHGPTGWCGRHNRRVSKGPCPFCGARRHEGRCPEYQLKPTPKEAKGEDGLQWYSRQDLDGPHRIAACPEHGRQIGELGFVPIGTIVEFPDSPSQPPLPVQFCAFCGGHGTVEELATCTCDEDLELCPLHDPLMRDVKWMEDGLVESLAVLRNLSDDMIDLVEESEEVPAAMFEQLAEGVQDVEAARRELDPFRRQLAAREARRKRRN